MDRGRRMLAIAALGLLAATGAAGCSASPQPSAAPPTAPAVSSAPASTPPSSPSTPAPGASNGQIENLLVTATVRTQLTATYATSHQIPVADVAGTLPNEVYYALDPATGTYWALATFIPSSKAPLSVQLTFQEGGSSGFFTRTSAGAWQMQTGHSPVPCGEIHFFPATVLTAWALPTTSSVCG